MPEGDTIYKIAAFMRPRIVGQHVLRAELLRRPSPELARREVLAVDVHGKHLLITLSPPGPEGWVLRVHLGMWGSWHSYPPGAPWKKPAWLASVVLDFGPQHTFVCFRAEQAALFRPRQTKGSEPNQAPPRLRQLGAQLITVGEGAQNAAAATSRASSLGALAAEGPPAGAPPAQTPSLIAPDLQQIWQALDRTSPDAPMVDVLLNQRIAAGIGNVYKSELLFLLQVDPMVPLGKVPALTLATLFLRARSLLEQNLGGWPRTTTRDLRRQHRPRGLPRLFVYGRVHRPCLVCERPIAKADCGRHARVTYWCRHCQPQGAVGLPLASAIVQARLRR